MFFLEFLEFKTYLMKIFHFCEFTRLLAELCCIKSKYGFCFFISCVDVINVFMSYVTQNYKMNHPLIREYVTNRNSFRLEV